MLRLALFTDWFFFTYPFLIFESRSRITHLYLALLVLPVSSWLVAVVFLQLFLSQSESQNAHTHC